MNESISIHRRNVLIVDDEPGNIQILARTLKDRCVTTAVTDGPDALEMVFSEDRPDLILLDIMMPGMNGYEVCERLKADPKTSNIPVIFITALNETVNEAKGFAMGAADYITKPFHPVVVEARVMMHLDLKKHRDHLEALAEQQAKQMVHMERLASLGTLAAGIAHEINNGLNFIDGSATVLEDIFKNFDEHPTEALKTDPATIPASESLAKKCLNFLGYIREGADRISAITRSMNRFSRGDVVRAPVLIADCIENALILCHNRLKHHVRVEKKIEQGILQTYGNRQQLEQVLINIFLNAADAMADLREGGLEITASRDQERVRVTMADTGPGIPDDKTEEIWKPFFTTKDQDSGTGLGLSICKGIVEDHQERLRAENRPEGGALFSLELPLVSSCDLPSKEY